MPFSAAATSSATINSFYSLLPDTLREVAAVNEI